jgi:glycolate oxidase iron-sulfur subunit
MATPNQTAPVEPAGRVPTGVRSPADDCVHCGFCLPACPTWQSWQEEMDSPRGRIDLFRAVAAGRVEMGPSVAVHFDRCLGCLGCLPACPSGVRYDHVIEEARARVEREYRRGLADRLHRELVFALFPHPVRLRVAAVFLWLFRATRLTALLRALGVFRLSRRLDQMERLAPDIRFRQLVARLPSRTAARGERRLRAGLLGGCVQRVFFPQVNEATIRVLAAEGIDVVVPAGQGCCGALSLHGGRPDEARRMARALVERFEQEAIDVVVVNAAGCGSHLKDLAHLFEGDAAFLPRATAFAARLRDVSELLDSLAPRAPRAPFRERVAYHSPCHLGHGQGVNEAPRRLLRTIPGLELVEIPEGDQCCGSAGIYNLVQPESADEIGRRKAANVRATNATLLASANPGCTLHVTRLLRESGATIEAAHPVEILDRAITRAERKGE